MMPHWPPHPLPTYEQRVCTELLSIIWNDPWKALLHGERWRPGRRLHFLHLYVFLRLLSLCYIPSFVSVGEASFLSCRFLPLKAKHNRTYYRTERYQFYRCSQFFLLLDAKKSWKIKTRSMIIGIIFHSIQKKRIPLYYCLKYSTLTLLYMFQYFIFRI